MARPLRIEYEGAFHHIIQRGIERRRIFRNDKDKEEGNKGSGLHN